MSYIELLGPPGAGKSTILSELIKRDALYGGTDEDAIQRTFFKKAPPRYRLPYRVTPAPIRRFVEEEFLEYRFRSTAIEDFIRTYPDFVDCLSTAMDAVTHEPEKLFRLCYRSAGDYQLGVSTVRDSEVLCLDESFSQRAFSILWREPDDSFSLQEYFDSVPIPDAAIYIDVPAEVCLRRQRSRERIAVDRDWTSDDLHEAQLEAQKLCLKTRDCLANQTSVITVENTRTVNTVVNEIRRRFFD